MNERHRQEMLGLVEKLHRLERAQLKDAIDLLNRCRDHMDADTSPAARTLRQDIWKFLQSLNTKETRPCFMCKAQFPKEELDAYGLCKTCTPKIGGTNANEAAQAGSRRA